MVLVSNGGVSSDDSHKRENGYMLKYKPRKVSAKRDFPPRCGRNGAQIKSKNGENVTGKTVDSEANVVKISATVTGVEVSESLNLTKVVEVGSSEAANKVVVDGVKSCEVGNVVNSSGVKNANIDIECQSHGNVTSPVDDDITESLDALVEKVTASACDEGKLMKEIGSTDFLSQNKIQGEKDEAFNNFVEVERAESLDAFVGQVSVTVDGFSNAVEKLTSETTPIRIDLPNNVASNPSKEDIQSEGCAKQKELDVVEGLGSVQNSYTAEAKTLLDAGASVNKIFLPAHSRSVHENIKAETLSRLKGKYRPRKVSAVRNYPPHCGTDLFCLKEEEKQMVNAGNDCVASIQTEVEPGATMSKKGLKGAAAGEMQTTSQVENSDGIHEVRVEFETTETFNDGGVRSGPQAEKLDFQEQADNPIEVEILGSEECPGDVKDGNVDISEASRTAPVSRIPSKDMIDDSSIKNGGGRVGNEVASHSLDKNDKVMPQHTDYTVGNEFHREVVYGLMAAPSCPWRKGKTALNTPDSATSGGKMRQQKRKSEPVALKTNREEDLSGGPSMKKRSFSDSHDTEKGPDSSTFMDDVDHGAHNECLSEVTPISMFNPALDGSNEDSPGPVGKEIVVYYPGENDQMSPMRCTFNSADEVDREIVQGLMAAPQCPWSKGKAVSNYSSEGPRREKVQKQNLSWRKKKAVAKKSTGRGNLSGGPSKKQKGVPVSNKETKNPGGAMLFDGGSYDQHGENLTDSPASQKTKEFDVRLPPFGPNNHNHGDARNRVRETLRLFHTICRKLLQKEEANTTPEEDGKSLRPGKSLRIDLHTAKIIKEKGKEVNTEKQYLGQVPGVEVGDEFQYRVELAVVGIHRLYQAGIDWMKLDGKPVATSIVASGAYADDMENADVLTYSGQGGNIIGKSKQPEDQKLERGNLALSNSASTGTPVRVVRGWKDTKVIDPLDPKPKTVTTYVYDGLYTVKKYWSETGPHGKMVYMFELRRNPCQPELAWKELKVASQCKFRPGLCVPDISGGKEPHPICAVNTLDDEKPPPFNYIAKMMYPNWYHQVPPVGCDCVGRCGDSRKCRCAVRNGGEIPYNRNGAIVEAKPVVYECGPGCKCPPSCYNRVTQRGIRFKLEIFKTESRGWGLRSLTSISSGSFICEYAGELLEDKEAEERIGNDEYLFDIGQNYTDSSLNPEEQAISVEITEEGGYTIDAAQYGNIGRFINHSCTPNLYAQNVIYDHDDKRMPHVMLFAAENIPPLQELTYHYNYKMDQVCDSDGNIKIKKCFCGSAECTGRMY